MKLTQSVTSLHDFQQPARLTLSEVQKHRTKEDAWMVLRGKVYNITPYLDYHPGGVDELMRGAGIDATVLFEEIHPWVAVDHMLSKAFLGNLELEDSSEVVTREGSAGPPPGRSPLSSTQWTPCTLLWRAPACESGVFQRYRFKLPPDIALCWSAAVQHIDVCQLLGPGGVILRPYTPISSLALPDEFELLVREYPSGKMTQHLASLPIGESLLVRPRPLSVHISATRVKLPTGDIKPSNFIMFAGGSGITPMLQVLQSLTDNSSDSLPPIHLIWAVPTRKDVPLRDHVTALCRKVGARVLLFVTREEAAAASDSSVVHGRFTLPVLAPFLPKPLAETVVIWSGPPGFAASVDAICRSLYYLASNFISLDA